MFHSKKQFIQPHIILTNELWVIGGEAEDVEEVIGAEVKRLVRLVCEQEHGAIRKELLIHQSILKQKENQYQK